MRYFIRASAGATSERRSRTRRRLWPLIALVASVAVGSLAYTHVSAAKMQAGAAASP